MPTPEFAIQTANSLRAIVAELRSAADEIEQYVLRMEAFELPEIKCGNDTSIRIAMRNARAYPNAVKKGIDEARDNRGDFGRPIPNGKPSDTSSDTARRKSNRNDGESAVTRTQKRAKK